MNKEQQFDTTIIGAGVTGLMLAKKLSDCGMRVALVESNDTIAAGPSTRNEGWLHNGTYHAISIKDEDAAVQVARRCMYGHDQIKRYAPECVENAEEESYALIRNGDKVDEALSRWERAQVEAKPIDKKRLNFHVPEINEASFAQAFQVADAAINTRILYHRLFHDAVRNGVEVMMGSKIDYCKSEPNVAWVKSPSGETLQHESNLYIHANGYGMKREFEEQFETEIPLRYWKSHLLVTDKLASRSVFYVDAHEAAMINHGNTSIIGLNEDAQIVGEPDYIPLEQNISRLQQATTRLFPRGDITRAMSVACVKVDVADSELDSRSLGLKILEPIEGHICVLPGKMTEAPFTTDFLTRTVCERLSGDDDIVALRPMDRRTLYKFQPQP